MKKPLLLVLCVFSALSTYSQTYKLETVVQFTGNDVYISHWRQLDGIPDQAANDFSLWQSYKDESTGKMWECQYYKGSPKEMLLFLCDLWDFSKEYEGVNNVIRYISGVQVKMYSYSIFGSINTANVLVYDRECKGYLSFTPSELSHMIRTIMYYCARNGIDYEVEILFQ